jgi:predicted protein tyrosine phosphatase
MPRWLFVCSQNRLRSPTAERIFSSIPGLEVASAGTAPDADEPVSPEWLDWADRIFAMEERHRKALSRRFQSHLKNKRIAVLEIPDEFEYMDPELIELLDNKMRLFLKLEGLIDPSEKR